MSRRGKETIKGAFQILPKKPFTLLPQKVKDPVRIALFTFLKDFDLKGIDKMEMFFDPFSVPTSSISSIRNISFCLSGDRIRNSNPKTVFKTSILTDRTEPLLRVSFESGKIIEYKTRNLTEVQILNHINLRK